MHFLKQDKIVAADIPSHLLDHPLIADRYFFPRPGHCPEPFWVDCGDARLACYYRRIDPGAGTLVHFHGNGEIIDDYLDDFVDLVAGMGWNCLLVEYRGYGRSSGRPELGKMLADVPRVIGALGQPPGNLVFFGRSVGSIFALEAVARFPDAAGLVLESGIADLLERLLLRLAPGELGVGWPELATAVKTQCDHREKLRNYAGPVLVLHASRDSLVDISHGERLYQWAAGPKRMLRFDRGDHNNVMVINAREYFSALREFLSSLELNRNHDGPART